MEVLNGNIEGIFNLSSLQEGMLFYYMMDKSTQNYLLQFSIEGVNDEEGIVFALDALVQKFPILKSSIVYEKLSQPKQVVLRDRKIEYSVSELKMGDRNDQEADKKRIIRDELERKFDLQRDSLIRAKYIKATACENMLLLTVHHILLDGWSLSLLIKEFLKLYVERDQCVEKGDLEGYKQYLNYVNKIDKSESINYWNNYLESYEGVTSIRPMQEDNFVLQDIYQIESFLFSEEQIKELENLCRKNRITLSNMFELAWGITLQQYAVRTTWYMDVLCQAETSLLRT